MYLNYYNLSLKPFEISPDPKFLWLGEKHKEALAVLKYGILENKGFLSLTGDVGTGKTTIVNALANSLGDNIISAKVLDPSLDEIDFFKLTASVFKLNKKFRTKGDFLSLLEQFLISAQTNNKDVVLIIEESQRIDQKLLEEVRLLSNIEQPDKKLITIIFVGQIEFNKKLTANRALRQRISINYTIDPLTHFETEQYISHRLTVAGSESKIFSQNAIHEIFSFSEGNPRLINVICDLALLSGYVNETKIIQPEIIRECADNFQNPKQPDEGGTKAQKALAKTIEEIRASKAPAKLDARKFSFLSLAIVITLACALSFFYFGGYDAFSNDTKAFLEKTFGRFTSSKSGSSIQQPNEHSGRQSAVAKPEAVRFDLKGPNSSEAAQINQLRSENSGLIAELEQLQSAQERVKKLQEETAQREQKLIRSEQMFTELTKNLEQEKKSKDIIQAELVSKDTLIKELQRRQKDSLSSNAKLKSELEKSKVEITRLRNQLLDFQAQKVPLDSKSVNAEKKEDLSAESDTIEPATESPKPGDIIDWIMKKKSQ